MFTFLAFSEQFGRHIAKRYRAKLVKFYQKSPILSSYESGRGISPPPLRDPRLELGQDDDAAQRTRVLEAEVFGLFEYAE